ncbi:hypothetical protein N9K75_02335, partial [bacterium]|nr:hypothetical protein [bacterium]
MEPISAFEVDADIREIKGEDYTEEEDGNDDDDDTIENYTEKEIFCVCMKLYQEELMEVCGLKEGDMFAEIGMRLEEVWIRLYETSTNQCERLKQLIVDYQDNMFRELSNRPHIHKLYFGLLFDFQIFHVIHRCIQEAFLNDGVVSDDLLDELDIDLNRETEIYNKK